MVACDSANLPGVCVDAVRLAPEVLAAARLERMLERLRCPDGPLDCIVDVENSEG